MSRPILPFPPPYAGSQQPLHLPPPNPSPPPPPPPPPPHNKPTYAKRGRITIVACLPCRRRKTKCDGKRPVCSPCLGREGHCQYDMTDEQRSLTFLRENLELLEREKGELESVLLTLQRASEEDVAEVMRILRTGNDLHTIARYAHSGRSLSHTQATSPSFESNRSGYTVSPQTQRSPQSEPYQSLVHTIAAAQPLELDEIVRRLRVGEEPASILVSTGSDTFLQTPLHESEDTQSMETEFSGRKQFGGLVKGTGSNGPQLGRPDTSNPPINHWTSVTDDREWRDHLISLYFSWQHQFFQNFPEKLFRADMDSGRTCYCSKLLVNALCAAGCLFSTSQRARRDQNDPGTAGMDFFEEAVRLLNEERVSKLTTTAALSVLCHIESNFSRLSSQWQYSGRSSRMALDLGLHLRTNEAHTNHPSAEAAVEIKAHAYVFWGCFVTEQVTSFTLGRLPSLPNNAITVDIPPVDPAQDEAEWMAHGRISQPLKSARSTTFKQVISLSKIVNSTLQMFFAPSRPISGSLLLEEHMKYTQWFAKLPAAITTVDNAPPHVLSMHMYYHAAVLLLFRPFLKARLTESDVSPQEICRMSANRISDLFTRHRQLYGLDGLLTFQLHCLLAACTIHIIKLPAISATTHLAAACHSFQDLVKHNGWAIGSLDIIRSLVRKWKIVLPLEVEAALYRDEDAPASTGDHTPTRFSLSSEQLDPHATTSPGSASTTEGPSTSTTASSSSRAEKRESHFPSPRTSRPLPKRARLAAPQLSGSSSTSAATAIAANASINTATTDLGVAAGGKEPPVTDTNLVPSTSLQQPLDASAYLFVPCPHQPAPLLGPIHTSTSHNGDDSGEGEGSGGEDEWTGAARTAWWWTGGFDGLNFAADDGFDPFMGYQGN